MQMSMRAVRSLATIFLMLVTPSYFAQVIEKKCYSNGCFVNSFFHGSRFSIEFPSEFHAADINGRSNESEAFSSPDNSVEFYVLYPSFGKGDSYLEPNPKTEKIVSKKDVFEKFGTITWITIAEKHNAYLRSYEIHKLSDGQIQWAVGIKYQNPAYYNKYKKKYLHFKKSFLIYHAND